MIWISANTEDANSTYYFELRDFELIRNGQSVKARIDGLIGNGYAEFPCEVELGQSEEVRIFPLWSEGRVEAVPEDLDSEFFTAQLLDSVRQFMPVSYKSELRRPACQRSGLVDSWTLDRMLVA